MKKLLLIIVILFTGIINVKATSTEEELQNLLDKLPNSYDLIVEENVKFEYKKDGFSYDGLNWLIKDYTYNQLFNLSSFMPNSEYSYTDNRENLKEYAYADKYILINKDNNNEKFDVTLLNLKNCYNSEMNIYSDCENRIEQTKTINLNINTIKDNSHNTEITNLLNEMNIKDEYSDFDLDWTWVSDYFTTPKTIKSIENKYNYQIKNIPFVGSDISNKDDDIDVPFHRDFIYIYKNNILYDLKFNFEVIDIFLKTPDNEYMNYYQPKLKLSDYDNIEEYIDDALEEFPTKAHLSNYEIINQSDGKRYTNPLEDNPDYYEVLINDLDNDVEWTMYFSGKLKVKETNIKGDLNNNGRIDLKDIILLIRLYLGLDN